MEMEGRCLARFWATERREPKQIPCGNDRKKGKGKDKNNSRVDSSAKCNVVDFI